LPAESTHFSGDSFSSIGKLISQSDPSAPVKLNAIGYDSSQPIPTAESPLGVPYPGETLTEGFNSPNWVSWITHKYRDTSENCLLAFDFAVGLHEIPDVRTQIHDGFIPSIGAKPDWALWDEDNTLFGAYWCCSTWWGLLICVVYCSCVGWDKRCSVRLFCIGGIMRQAEL
jgi:hypothetical protein